MRKNGVDISIDKLGTMNEVKTAIFRYVFGYYNTIRVTSFNPAGLPPVAYREVYLSQSIAA